MSLKDDLKELIDYAKDNGIEDSQFDEYAETFGVARDEIVKIFKEEGVTAGNVDEELARKDNLDTDELDDEVDRIVSQCSDAGQDYIAEKVLLKKHKKNSKELKYITEQLKLNKIAVYNEDNTAEIELDIDEDEIEEIELNDDEINKINSEITKLQTVEDSSMPIRVDDPVRLYLKEIGSVELIEHSREIELAKIIEEGKAAREKMGKLDELGLSEDEVDELKRTLIRSEKAEHELVQANLRLVVSIAKSYTKRGLQFLDLIQEGNMGLMKAVYKYDYEKGYKFSTYATWWIRQSITRAVADQARTIRVPVHMVETINKMVRTQRQLVQKLSREPRPEEIAAEMGKTVEQIQHIQKIAQDPISLESPIGEEEDSSLGDFICDKDVLDPLEYTSREMLKKELDEVLHTLTDREEKVLRLRFGLVDGRPRTLEEVGKNFGVTRERIRQIEAKAIRKLKHPARSNKLKDFVTK